jgi:hypothetical protein
MSFRNLLFHTVQLTPKQQQAPRVHHYPTRRRSLYSSKPRRVNPTLSLEDPAFVTVPPQPHALNASGELNGHTLFEQDLDLDQGITVDPFIPQSDYALRVHA